MNKTNFLFKTDGTDAVTPKNGTDFQLDELTELLDCDLIEIAYPSKSSPVFDKYEQPIFIIDEEGKLKSLEVNRIASALCFFEGGDVIAGPALLCESSKLK